MNMDKYMDMDMDGWREVGEAVASASRGGRRPAPTHAHC